MTESRSIKVRFCQRLYQHPINCLIPVCCTRGQTPPVGKPGCPDATLAFFLSLFIYLYCSVPCFLYIFFLIHNFRVYRYIIYFFSFFFLVLFFRGWCWLVCDAEFGFLSCIACPLLWRRTCCMACPLQRGDWSVGSCWETEGNKAKELYRLQRFREKITRY